MMDSMDDEGCPGCKKTKPQSNSSGVKKNRKFGNRAMRRAYDAQEKRKEDKKLLAQETSSKPKYKHGGSVLGFDVNNLKTSNFKKLK